MIFDELSEMDIEKFNEILKSKLNNRKPDRLKELLDNLDDQVFKGCEFIEISQADYDEMVELLRQSTFTGIKPIFDKWGGKPIKFV